MYIMYVLIEVGLCQYNLELCIWRVCRLRSQEEAAKLLESEKRKISDAAQDLQANLEVSTDTILHWQRTINRPNVPHEAAQSFLLLT